MGIGQYMQVKSQKQLRTPLVKSIFLSIGAKEQPHGHSFTTSFVSAFAGDYW